MVFLFPTLLIVHERTDLYLKYAIVKTRSIETFSNLTEGSVPTALHVSGPVDKKVDQLDIRLHVQEFVELSRLVSFSR